MLLMKISGLLGAYFTEIKSIVNFLFPYLAIISDLADYQV